jgi:hypothetical protein
MSRDFFNTLADEVDALLGAGSAAASTNHRLPQRARTLREMARQVPALNALADTIDRVCQPDPRESSRALLDLVLLARQVRVGMGTEALKGEVLPLPPSGPWANNLPADELYRMVDAVRADSCNADLVEPLVPHDLRLFPLVTLSPVQLGKASELIAQLDRWGDEGNRAALRLLPTLGRAVLPELERDFDFSKRPGAGRRLAAMGLIDPEAAVQFCLRWLPQQPGMLGVLGKVGGPAIAVFVRVLAQPHGNYAYWDLETIAITLLNQVPETAVQVLCSTMQSPDPAQRKEAIELLQFLGKLAANAVPDLIESLKDSVPLVRQAAAQALGQIGRSSSVVSLHLIACLKDTNREVQRAAATALPRLGVPAAKIVPLLIEVLDHPDEQVRLALIDALGRSAFRNKTAQAALRQARDRETSTAARTRIDKALKKK